MHHMACIAAAVPISISIDYHGMHVLVYITNWKLIILYHTP